jgi:hypothetical protein
MQFEICATERCVTKWFEIIDLMGVIAIGECSGMGLGSFGASGFATHYEGMHGRGVALSRGRRWLSMI